MLRIPDGLRTFIRRETGGMTLLGLYLGVTMLIVGGLALDVMNLVAVRTQLQSASDFAAHAALYRRTLGDDPDTARAKALQMVENVYPDVIYGDMLTAADIKFGRYTQATNGFEVDEMSKEAAMAYSGRTRDRGNSVIAYLTKIVGYDRWDVLAVSVYATYRPACLRDGWVGEDVVDAQSNNVFVDGYCIHSNTEVQFNSNSTFACDEGVTVSTFYGQEGVTVPTSGYTSNIGLGCAVVPRSIHYNLRIFNHLDMIFAGLFDSESEYYRSWLNGTPETAITLPGKNVSTADFTVDGGYYTYNCNGPNAKLTIDASAQILRRVMIRTNCKTVFSNSSKLEDVVLWVDNSIDKSVTSAQDLRLGKPDNCQPGGGVNIITMGGFEVPQGLEMFGSQVLAKGPIQFSAGPNGEGGSLISLSTVNGTSNGSSWGACANNGGEVFEIDQFAMVH